MIVWCNIGLLYVAHGAQRFIYRSEIGDPTGEYTLIGTISLEAASAAPLAYWPQLLSPVHKWLRQAVPC